MEGPVNDVELVSDLLRNQFEFKQDNILVLATNPSSYRMPSKESITTSIEQLIKVFEPNESNREVFLYFSGHGSRQPNLNPKLDFEGDSLDEVFLPHDVGIANGTFLNAITDDEIAKWIKDLNSKGISVTFVADFCHSGSSIRGHESLKSRNVELSSIVGEKVIEEILNANNIADQGGREEEPNFSEVSSQGMRGIAAIYASLDSQSTFEERFPLDNPTKTYGWLTFTLNEICRSSNRKLTYREIEKRLRHRYLQRGWYAASPDITSNNLDREFVGVTTWNARSSISYSKSGNDILVDKGKLHGLTPKSVLGIYPVVGSENDEKLLGHIELVSCDFIESKAKFSSHEEFAAPANTIPTTGRCEIAYRDLSKNRFRVSIDKESMTDSQFTEISRALSRATEMKSAAFELVNENSMSDYAIGISNGAIRILSLRRGKNFASEFSISLEETNNKLSEWLFEHLQMIARWHGLLKLASVDSSSFGLSISTARKDSGEEKFEAFDWESHSAEDLIFNDGDKLRLRLTNGSGSLLDVNILYLDSAGSIQCFLPFYGENGWDEEVRIHPDKTKALDITLNDESIGIEHMIFVVTKVANPNQPKLDLSCLEKNVFTEAVKAERTVRGDGDSIFGSELGELLGESLYSVPRSATRSGLKKQQFEIFAISWKVTQH